MDGGAWKAAVHGVAEGRMRLSDFTFTFHFHVLEKEMATHSSVLAWRIPGMGEPGGLPSMGRTYGVIINVHLNSQDNICMRNLNYPILSEVSQFFLFEKNVWTCSNSSFF